MAFYGQFTQGQDSATALDGGRLASSQMRSQGCQRNHNINEDDHTYDTNRQPKRSEASFPNSVVIFGRLQANTPPSEQMLVPKHVHSQLKAQYSGLLLSFLSSKQSFHLNV